MSINHSYIPNNKTYSSKLLLFGEYTILLGETALATPFDGFHGNFDFLKNKPGLASQESNTVLKEYFKFVEKSELSAFFDLKRLEQEIKSGLIFSSNIPRGYGLGSSGAVCAAIAEEYGNSEIKKLDYPGLKGFFSTMESFFHGKSSGIDPLVIYLNTPLLIHKENIENVDVNWKHFKSANLSVFLLDTQTTGKTAPLVEWFSEQMKKESYKQEILHDYIPSLQKAINNFLIYDQNKFNQAIHKLSSLQLKVFKPMIPMHIIDVWGKGIETGEYYLKLCGSGGGGYVLGFSLMNKERLLGVFRNMSVGITYIP